MNRNSSSWVNRSTLWGKSFLNAWSYSNEASTVICQYNRNSPADQSASSEHLRRLLLQETANSLNKPWTGLRGAISSVQPTFRNSYRHSYIYKLLKTVTVFARGWIRDQTEWKSISLKAFISKKVENSRKDCENFLLIPAINKSIWWLNSKSVGVLHVHFCAHKINRQQIAKENNK